MSSQASKPIATIAFVLLWASPCFGQLSAELVAAENTYESCATATALHYSTGTDAADFIAKAATEACRAEMQAMGQSLQREGKSTTFVVAFIEQVNSDLVTKLKLRILEWRAKK